MKKKFIDRRLRKTLKFNVLPPPIALKTRARTEVYVYVF